LIVGAMLKCLIVAKQKCHALLRLEHGGGSDGIGSHE
jgi:hypothetical protein